MTSAKLRALLLELIHSGNRERSEEEEGEEGENKHIDTLKITQRELHGWLHLSVF